MTPIVKNITINNIENIDTNQDGQITPDEIKMFWTSRQDMHIQPDEQMIKKYIIEPAFKNGIMSIEKTEYISSLNPNNVQSVIVNITSVNQGMIFYVFLKWILSFIFFEGSEPLI